MTEQHETGEQVLAGRLGELAGMVLMISRAVEQLAGETDEGERHQIAVQMRELRTIVTEWGVNLPEGF